MAIKFSELKKKDVVNVLTGKILGKICDLVVDEHSGKILSVIVPGRKNSFLSYDNMEIKYCCVVKIGDDAILVKNGISNLVKPCENSPCKEGSDIISVVSEFENEE